MNLWRLPNRRHNHYLFHRHANYNKKTATTTTHTIAFRHYYHAGTFGRSSIKPRTTTLPPYSHHPLSSRTKTNHHYNCNTITYHTTSLSITPLSNHNGCRDNRSGDNNNKFATMNGNDDDNRHTPPPPPPSSSSPPHNNSKEDNDRLNNDESSSPSSSSSTTTPNDDITGGSVKTTDSPPTSDDDDDDVSAELLKLAIGTSDEDEGTTTDQNDDGSDDDDSDSDDSSDDDDDDDDDDGSPTLKTIARWINEGSCSNIVILSGAGVSCAAGIPDFRTPGSGLYDNLQRYNLPYPQAVFDLAFFRCNPHPFISLARDIWPGKYPPTLTHLFVALLSQKNLLLRNYTQNIDGLEHLANIPTNELVECHGHFRTATCVDCGRSEEEGGGGGGCCEKDIKEGRVTRCRVCGGYVKPDIVFFGEGLPGRFRECLRGDLVRVDLLFVMGTSLTVAPVSMIPEMVPMSTPRVLFNRELVGDFEARGGTNTRDVWEPGNCDESVRKLCRYLGWEDELDEMYAATRNTVGVTPSTTNRD